MKKLLPWAVLAAAVALVFGRTVSFPFLGWDDDTAVTANPYLAPASLENLGRFWSAPRTGLYVPVSFTVLWLEARISAWTLGQGAFDPRVFHLVLLLFHLGCAGLVFAILARLVSDARAALLGALLFALHPLQTESVAWITETRGVAAAFFALLSLERYLAAASSEREGAAARDVAIAGVAFVLALLAKPTAVALPLIALLLDRFALRRPLRRSLPVLGVGFGLALLLVWITKSQQVDSTIRFGAPAWARPLVALDAVAFYLAKVFWPVGLVADYGRKPAWLLEQGGFWLHGILPVGLALLAALDPGRRWWLLALGVFVVAIAPVSGLVPFHFQDISTVADRYAYLALLGPAIALAALVARRKEAFVAATAGAIVAGLGGLAFVQAGYWRDTEALFRRTLEANPKSVVALVNLGVAEGARGDVEEAARRYRAAIEIDPDHPVARGNLGAQLLVQGQLEEAVLVLGETVRRSPDYPFARQNLAIALVKLGRMGEAEGELRQGLVLQPGYHGLHLTLGQLLYVTGRIQEAVLEFGAAVEIFGNSADAHQGLALSFEKLGKQDLAERHRRLALELRGAK